MSSTTSHPRVQSRCCLYCCSLRRDHPYLAHRLVNDSDNMHDRLKHTLHKITHDLSLLLPLGVPALLYRGHIMFPKTRLQLTSNLPETGHGHAEGQGARPDEEEHGR